MLMIGSLNAMSLLTSLDILQLSAAGEAAQRIKPNPKLKTTMAMTMSSTCQARGLANSEMRYLGTRDQREEPQQEAVTAPAALCAETHAGEQDDSQRCICGATESFRSATRKGLDATCATAAFKSPSDDTPNLNPEKIMR